MINLVVAKFLRTFFTSLVIYISKKLIFHIDQLSSDFIKDQRNIEYITCDNCSQIFRAEIIRKIALDHKCPSCLSKLSLAESSNVRPEFA